MTALQAPSQRPKLFGWKAIFILIVVTNYSAMIYVFHTSSNNNNAATNTSFNEHLIYSQLPPPSQEIVSSATNNINEDDNNKRRLDNDDNSSNNSSSSSPQQPPILLAGMAFSDNTISDYALTFLLQAACTHNLHSHILLARRDTNSPLDKKIQILSAHLQPLPLDGRLLQVMRPKCANYIHVEVAPSEEYLLNMTKSYHNSSHSNATIGSSSSSMMLLQEDTPNNPWNEHNRIARIKRSREYQRQLVIQLLTDRNNNNHNQRYYNDQEEESSWGGVDYDWSTSKEAVIGVLDLDLFDYPTPLELIETARNYIAMSSSSSSSSGTTSGMIDNNNNHNDQTTNNKKYHAICTNGLFVMKSRSYNGYRRRYYDTFSTILLPNSWLHVDRDKPRGSLEGEDVEMAKMNQDETLQWILREGTRHHPLPNEDDEEEEDEGQQLHQLFQPVPVRSCFNGLTLYRADVWLEPKCRYDSYHKDDDAYLSKRYQHACEHIVFHECLRRVLLEKSGEEGGSSSSGEVGLDIAVQPDLTTLWHHLS